MTKFKAIALNIIFVVVIAILIVANVLANFWSGALTLALGSIGGYNPEGTQYFTSEFEKDEDLISAQEAFSLDVVEEGAVLLKNDGEALPLAENERNISVFSINQREWVRNGSGSSSVPLNPNYANKTIMASLKDAGLTVNAELEEYYESQPYTPRKNRASRIDEVPWADVYAACGDTWNAANEVAIVIFSRVGGEGSDSIRDMSTAGGLATEHYLELDATEKDLLRGIKAEGFKKTIVILNTTNALEMNFLDEEEFGVDACFWVGGTGLIGVDAVGQILTGERTPSGHAVDTYLKDNFATPTILRKRVENFKLQTIADEIFSKNIKLETCMQCAEVIARSVRLLSEVQKDRFNSVPYYRIIVQRRRIRREIWYVEHIIGENLMRCALFGKEHPLFPLWVYKCAEKLEYVSRFVDKKDEKLPQREYEMIFTGPNEAVWETKDWLEGRGLRDAGDYEVTDELCEKVFAIYDAVRVSCMPYLMSRTETYHPNEYASIIVQAVETEGKNREIKIDYDNLYTKYAIYGN